LNPGGSLPFGITPETLVQTRPRQLFEYFDKDQARDEPSDMSPPGDPSYVPATQACREDLDEQPVSEKDEGWDLDKLEEKEDGNQGENPGAGEEKDVTSHHPGDRTAGADGGDLRTPVCEEMNQTGSDAAQEIENEVAEMTDPILDIIPEDVEKPHVPQDVEDSSMKEHGGQKGQDLLNGGKMGRDVRIRISCGNDPEKEKSLFKVRTLGKLPEEGENIENDDQNIDDGKMTRPYGIPYRNHLKINIDVSFFENKKKLTGFAFWSKFSS